MYVAQFVSDRVQFHIVLVTLSEVCIDNSDSTARHFVTYSVQYLYWRYSARTEFTRMWLSHGWYFCWMHSICRWYNFDISIFVVLAAHVKCLLRDGKHKCTIDIVFNPEKSFCLKLERYMAKIWENLELVISTSSGLIGCDVYGYIWLEVSSWNLIYQLCCAKYVVLLIVFLQKPSMFQTW